MLKLLNLNLFGHFSTNQTKHIHNTKPRQYTDTWQHPSSVHCVLQCCYVATYIPDWWVRADVNLSSAAAQSPHPHGAPTPPEEGSQWAWSFGSGATANLSQRGVWPCQGCLGLHTETPLPFPLFPHLKEKWIDDAPRSSLSTKYQVSSLVVVVHT